MKEEQLNIIGTEDMDTRLYKLFENEKVPDELNVALKNKLMYEAGFGRKKIDLWWMPAVLNTVITIVALLLSVLFFELARIGGSYTIIPNIIDMLSAISFKIVFVIAFIDILIGWLATAIVIPAASGRNAKD